MRRTGLTVLKNSEKAFRPYGLLRGTPAEAVKNADDKSWHMEAGNCRLDSAAGTGRPAARMTSGVAVAAGGAL